jgi:hypothetical protein
MGLLMSDTMTLDPMLDDTMRWREGLSEWAYVFDTAADPHGHETADPAD